MLHQFDLVMRTSWFMKNGRTAVFHSEAARRVAHKDMRHEKTAGQPFFTAKPPEGWRTRMCAMKKRNRSAYLFVLPTRRANNAQ